MTSPGHDTIVYRLSQILILLNLGERLDPQQLANEFGVTLRTIQRDLNERFAYLPLQREGKRYFLDPAFLGRLGTRDIERFASLAGIKGLFPSFSDEFLREIFNERMQSAFLIKGHQYEYISNFAALFRQLETAIVDRRCVSFNYIKNDSEKFYSKTDPYKLINNNGLWYLAAKDKEKIKTFSLGKMSQLITLIDQYIFDKGVDERLKNDEGVWVGNEDREVVIKISKDVAWYFRRRRLIANQVVEKELEDGGLIVSAKVGHLNQVLPIVRYWIPHLRIISPEGVQAEMEKEISVYLCQSNFVSLLKSEIREALCLLIDLIRNNRARCFQLQLN